MLKLQIDFGEVGERGLEVSDDLSGDDVGLRHHWVLVRFTLYKLSLDYAASSI